MKKIVITNSLDYLEKHFAGNAQNGAFIILSENEKTRAAERYLSGLSLTKITKRELSGRYGEPFKKDFSKSLYGLNTVNSSAQWWAMDFTSKNPLLSTLFENSFYSAAIAELLNDIAEGAALVVISNNRDILKQLFLWGRASGVEVTGAINAQIDLKESFKIYTPIGIINIFFKIAVRKLLSNFLLGKMAARRPYTSVIVSQFVDRSIGKDGLYRDAFFGGLKEVLGKKGKAVTIGYVNCRFSRFIYAVKSAKQNRDIYPFEHFVAWKGMLEILLLSVKKYFTLPTAKGSYKIFNVDLSYILKKEISKSISSGQFFSNMAIFKAVRSFSSIIDAAVFYYPFENRSWEKMVILAARDASKNIKLVGYQHAAITPNHLNFYLEEGEYYKIPSPDEIITMGYVTRDLMIKSFHFPEDRVSAGCALRQKLPEHIPGSKSELKVKRLLVALASSIDEYVRVLQFLDSALRGVDRFTVIIRPHPAVSLDQATRIFRPRNLKYELDRLPLYDSLKESDAVLYVSSTVSLEAISLGIPVICLDLYDILSSDPLFGISYLKWSCKDPERLISLLDDMSKIDLKRFLDAEREARKFAESYCVESDERVCAEVFG